MKVLIADDDADLRELIAFTLAQAGYLVIKAADGPSAVQRFAEESADLVVLDVNMPGLSGFQVCESIRARSTWAPTTISPSRSVRARCWRASRR
jgi:DNA-binding response OmpR family regulator